MSAYYNEFDPYAAQWLRNLISAGLIAPGNTTMASEGRQGFQDRTRGKKGSQESLSTQVVRLSLWSTLRASDGAKGGPNMSFGAGGSPLPSQVSAAANSSNAPTENGAGSLHPEFAGWELGYPPEWLSCAPSETPSTLGRRRK